MNVSTHLILERQYVLDRLFDLAFERVLVLLQQLRAVSLAVGVLDVVGLAVALDLGSGGYVGGPVEWIRRGILSVRQASMSRLF